MSRCLPGALDRDTGISPTPNAYSIANWPGAKSSSGSPAGSSTSVTVSWVSSRRSTTR